MELDQVGLVMAIRREADFNCTRRRLGREYDYKPIYVRVSRDYLLEFSVLGSTLTILIFKFLCTIFNHDFFSILRVVLY